jgi:uracil-DNA glycosylase
MLPGLPDSWKSAIGDELNKPYFEEIESFLAAELALGEVYPPPPDIFAALRHTPFEQVRVLVLGQDPYPGAGQAHGLCFSVQPGVKPPASLRNIFKELHDDLGHPIPKCNGSLVPWARQGVLLLNTVLTVRAGKPLSHRRRGWETFTDAIIEAVGHKPDRVVFLLWGAQAQAKKKLIDAARHCVVESAHPSPLSAQSGFFGSKPCSQVNAALRAGGAPEIDWRIEDDLS